MNEIYEIDSIVEIIKVVNKKNSGKLEFQKNNEVAIIKGYEFQEGKFIGYLLENNLLYYWLHEELEYLCHLRETEPINKE